MYILFCMRFLKHLKNFHSHSFWFRCNSKTVFPVLAVLFLSLPHNSLTIYEWLSTFPILINNSSEWPFCCRYPEGRISSITLQNFRRILHKRWTFLGVAWNQTLTESSLFALFGRPDTTPQKEPLTLRSFAGDKWHLKISASTDPSSTSQLTLAPPSHCWEAEVHLCPSPHSIFNSVQSLHE